MMDGDILFLQLSITLLDRFILTAQSTTKIQRLEIWVWVLSCQTLKQVDEKYNFLKQKEKFRNFF